MSGRGAEFATLSDHLEEESVGRQWAVSGWPLTAIASVLASTVVALASSIPAVKAGNSTGFEGGDEQHRAIGHAKYALSRANVVNLATTGGRYGARTHDLYGVNVAL